MKKTVLALGAAVLATAGSAAVVHAHQAGAGMGMHRMMQDPFGNAAITRADAQAKATEMFVKHDANGDGKLDPADGAARMGQRFDTMDTNRDGSLSRQEFLAAHAQAKAGHKMGHDGAGQEGRGQRSMGQGSMGQGSMGHEGMGHEGISDKGGRKGMDHKGMGGMLMMGMDANGDLTITRDEFVAGVLKRFDAADTNRDGALTSEERRAAMQKHMGEMRGGMNKDGAATPPAAHDHGAMPGN
ncbi:MAG: hypothetical protein V4579_09650 [Pseudomonadota bacterium]